MILDSYLRSKVLNLLALADVSPGGRRPWDIVVHNDRFYGCVVARGALGLGESYVDGWWDCEDLAEFFRRILSARLDRRASCNVPALLAFLRARFANRQRKSLAASNVRQHYDIGNDLYRNMLGSRMLYSSANWQHACNLEEAGQEKLDFVCRRLNLSAGQKVLDIGCGWGGFAKYAAQRYGVRVLGITVSTEQASLARQICADLPVEIRYQDYRDLHEQFDHVVSLGMFEHVGYKNYRGYMQIVRRCLKSGGLFFLNTIGANESGLGANPWIDRYIFPGAMLPSIPQIGAAIDGLFGIEELREWSESYDRTLLAWFEKFHFNWGKLRSRYGERFYRMWKYYLLSSAGAFRSKAIRDWQIVLSG